MASGRAWIRPAASAARKWLRERREGRGLARSSSADVRRRDGEVDAAEEPEHEEPEPLLPGRLPDEPSDRPCKSTTHIAPSGSGLRLRSQASVPESVSGATASSVKKTDHAETRAPHQTLPGRVHACEGQAHGPSDAIAIAGRPPPSRRRPVACAL